MWKAALVGAFALATVGALSASAQDFAALAPRADTSSGIVVTESHIARFKGLLRLTAEQERHWPPVEAALRDLARQQGQGEEGARARQAALTVTMNPAAIRRLASAAQPLIKSLDPEQKRIALQVAQSIGMGDVAAAF